MRIRCVVDLFITMNGEIKKAVSTKFRGKRISNMESCLTGLKVKLISSSRPGKGRNIPLIQVFKGKKVIKNVI